MDKARLSVQKERGARVRSAPLSYNGILTEELSPNERREDNISLLDRRKSKEGHMKKDPDLIWRLTRRFNPRAIKTFSRPRRLGPEVLLLTTIGRKTGLPRVTPLQFEFINGAYYVGAARGWKADWLRNLQQTPRVEVQIGEEKFPALAEPITDVARVADLLEYRLRKHPVMIRAILLTHGLPLFPKRAHLEKLAGELVFVILRRA
jgi:deazaflavin-dependent oxidoreductase (nitroreductase family)